MFEDILTSDDPKPFKFGPSDMYVMYFKDGEAFEYDVSISGEELLNALPMFPRIDFIENGPAEFVEFVKAQLLLEKCLLFESDVV